MRDGKILEQVGFCFMKAGTSDPLHLCRQGKTASVMCHVLFEASANVASHGGVCRFSARTVDRQKGLSRTGCRALELWRGLLVEN